MSHIGLRVAHRPVPGKQGDRGSGIASSEKQIIAACMTGPMTSGLARETTNGWNVLDLSIVPYFTCQ